MGIRLACALIALLCAGAAAWLAAHHPLQPAAMGLACALLGCVTVVRFSRWPLALLPLLPLAGLAPWTGWLVVEEWDLLVLATAAGGYARLALGLPGKPKPGSSPRLVVWVVLALYACLTLVAMFRGVANAGGWSWGWWQGYREPLNSLRLAKPVMEVVLLLPLWQVLYGRDHAAAVRTLLQGMILLTCVAALPVWWERIAFPGLLNASSDYRATGFFWEMHVGGAALDAVLSMGAPFVLLGLLTAGRTRAWVICSLVGAVTFYAALATFSRIVYVAVPAALLVCGLLHLRRGPTAGHQAPRGLVLAATLLVALALAAIWLFPVAGYRGLLALLGTFVLLLLTRRRVAAAPLGAANAAAALLAIGVVVVVSVGLAKGAYVAFAGCWLLGMIGCWHGRKDPVGRLGALLAYGGFIGALAGLVAVAWYWGGAGALDRAWPVALCLLLLWLLTARPGPWVWPEGVRWHALVTVGAACMMAVVAVFSGGSYMGDRVTNVAQDSHDRQRHWQLLFDLLRTPDDRILGYGLGRVPTQLATAGVPEVSAGDIRLSDGAGSHLMLAAAMHVQGWGEMLRISQRIERPAPGSLKVRLRIRSPAPISLHTEVCNKHLLYDGQCKTANLALKAGTEAWQPMELDLTGDDLSPGPWYAPRMVVFSLALDQQGARAEVDDVQLLDLTGRELLRNGSFSDGLEQWFLTSDRHHMPWHAKNMAVHLWFEQGPIALGLLACASLLLFARALGSVRAHPLMPAVAGAMVGIVIVGQVDSVFDIPRAAFLALWMLGVGLGLHMPPSRPALPAVRN